MITSTGTYHGPPEKGARAGWSTSLAVRDDCACSLAEDLIERVFFSVAILLYYSLFPATLFVIDNKLQSLDTGVTKKARPTVNAYDILKFNL
jgi:hypothetical protein